MSQKDEDDDQGKTSWRLGQLEDRMKKIDGDEPSTLKGRVSALEHDRTNRLAVQATIGAVLTAAVAIGSSGVIGAVEKVRVKLEQATEARATLRPPPEPATAVVKP